MTFNVDSTPHFNREKTHTIAVFTVVLTAFNLWWLVKRASSCHITPAANPPSSYRSATFAVLAYSPYMLFYLLGATQVKTIVPDLTCRALASVAFLLRTASIFVWAAMWIWFPQKNMGFTISQIVALCIFFAAWPLEPICLSDKNLIAFAIAWTPAAVLYMLHRHRMC